MRLPLAVALVGRLGCVSPVVLDSAVLEYDRALNRSEAELLLLDIARARHHRPIHFTAVSSIEIAEGDNAPDHAEFAVEIEDRDYWIRKLPVSEGMVSSWHQQAFAALTNLFQMTVTDVSATPAPVISIPK